METLDIILAIALAAFLVCTHIIAYHYGAVDALDRLDDELQEMTNEKEEV